jgi:hypothetical protein
MLLLLNVPLSLLNLIPGLILFTVPLFEPLNLLLIAGAYFLTQQFPDQAQLIWMALLF